MSGGPPDFLDRMVDKAFGRQMAIDPRLPSVFEPRGFGFEAEEPAGAVRFAAAHGKGGDQAGDGIARPGHDAHAEPGGTQPKGLALAARTTALQRRDISPMHAGDVPAHVAGHTGPATQTAPQSPEQAVLVAVMDAVPATGAPRGRREAEDGEAAGGAAPNSQADSATQPEASRSGTVAPKQFAVTRGSVRQSSMAKTPPATVSAPGALQRQIAEPGPRASQPPGDDIATIPDRDVAIPPHRAEPLRAAEHAAAPDRAAEQGALLPVATPMPRAPFAQSLAAQRPPQGGEAREASPSVVNVTIGRVEVRAAAAPAQRGGEKREPKPLSLADYLQKRSER